MTEQNNDRKDHTPPLPPALKEEIDRLRSGIERKADSLVSLQVINTRIDKLESTLKRLERDVTNIKHRLEIM